MIVALVVLWSAVPMAGPVDASAPAGWTPTGSTTPVHDPTIVREGDTWYLFSTWSRLPVRRSTDLAHWTDVGVVFPDGLPSWVTATLPPGLDDHVWAPDVAYFSGRWHLYYSKAKFATQDAVIGLATSPTLDPEAPGYGWVDHGLVVRSEPGDPVTAIDPSVVIDEAGDPWLTWGSFWEGIVIQRLDPATGLLQPDAARVTLAAREPWWYGVEGAQVFRRDGWWWLQVSFGFCCRGVDSFYAVHLGRSRSITGPYVDLAGVPMTDGGGTLLIGSYGDRIGNGHGTIFEADPGRWYLVHHYYDGANAGVPTLGFTPLVDLDGWPIGTDPEFTPSPDPAPLVPGTWHLVGYRESGPAHPSDDVVLGLRADGTVAEGGTWRVSGQVLEIRDVPITGAFGLPAVRTWRTLVDTTGDLALGRDERTAGVRLTRIGPPPPVEPATTTAPITTAPPASVVTLGPGVVGPSFTG